MFYDTNISESVPVAKAFDMLVTCSDFESALHFLQCCGDNARRVMSESACVSRLFQSDVLSGFSNADASAAFELLKSVPECVGLNLVWQICLSRSGNADKLKYEFRKEISDITSGCLRHPHRFAMPAVRLTDIRLTSSRDTDTTVGYMSTPFLRHAHSSLFIGRIVQPDVIERLTEQQLDALCETMCGPVTNPYWTKCFVRNLFDSGVSPDVKSRFCFNTMPKSDFLKRDADVRRVMDAVESCGSCAEFELRRTIEGDYDEIAVTLGLLRYAPTWFFGIYESDRAGIDSVIDMSWLEAK